MWRFRKLDVNFGSQCTIEQIVENKAFWHKQCHQTFNNLMLKHMQLKRKIDSTAEDSGSSQPKHQSLPIAQDVCLFCKIDGKSEQLHEFTTFNADKSLKLMAT